MNASYESVYLLHETEWYRASKAYVSVLPTDGAQGYFFALKVGNFYIVFFKTRLKEIIIM